MQIKPHSEMTRDEAIMLWHGERAENEMLRQQLAEAHAELEAIGAGGVSGTPITKPGHLELIADAAEIIDTLTSKLPDEHPLHVAARDRAKRAVAGLYALAEGETV